MTRLADRPRRAARQAECRAERQAKRARRAARQAECRAERQAKRARRHLRLCIDCAHHRPETAPATPGLTVDYCGHPRANTDPVDGTVARHWSKSLCSNLRTDPHQCGVQGRWWKRKD